MTPADPPSRARVNLGCGLHALDGWINFDRSPGVVLQRLGPLRTVLVKAGVLTPAHAAPWPPGIRRHDVTRGVPLPDGSAEAIYSSHMLEHLFLDEARTVLAECRRVLAGDGVLRLALPDASAAARALVDAPDDSWQAALDFNRTLNAFPLTRPPRRQIPARLLGSSGAHKWQPTPGLVTHLLRDVGFREVRPYEYREGRLPDLEVVEHRPDSFFLEAE